MPKSAARASTGGHDLRAVFDRTISLEVPFDVLERRLLRCLTDMGSTSNALYAGAHQNDLPNAKTVIENSDKADTIFRS